MQRKWLVAGVVGVLALVAVLALVVGGEVGRSIVPAPEEPTRPATERFADTLTDVAISYPANWVRANSSDQAVRILVTSPDGSAGVRVSVRKTELEPVTEQGLPAVRQLIDDLLKAEGPINVLAGPDQVTVDGLPGYRYVYTYRNQDNTDAAHVRYFLFKGARLVQIVMQASPAERLPTLQPTFDRIVDTFEGRRR